MYDAENRLTSMTGPDGVLQASYAYDLAGNLIRETDGEGNSTYRTYIPFGEVRELLRPAMQLDGEMLYEKTTWQYDACGNLICEQRHGGYWDQESRLVKEEGFDLSLHFSYDKRNRRIRVEDGLGAVICYRYDVQGKLIYEEKAISEDVRQIIHYRYDRAGRLVEQKEELNSGLSPVKGQPRYAITRYGYDENGNRTEIITPEGYQIHRTYDACDRIISERVLDKPNGIDRTTQVSYDLAGNITKITRGGKGQEAWEIAYDYDLKDRITHVKDCLGPVFQYTYDKDDRLSVETLPQTAGQIPNRNTYVYDAYGKLLTKTDGAEVIQQENRYLPDGKLLQSREADGQEIEYRYTVQGMETEVSTARSRQENKPAQQYSYDSRGRLQAYKTAMKTRPSMQWMLGDVSIRYTMQTAEQRTIPMTSLEISPAPKMQMAVSLPTVITVRGRSARL